MISGEKILVTGVTGSVGRPLAEFLAGENEVWGVARFADGAARQQLEDAGVTTRALDIGDGDFTDVPDDFTYVLHLSWLRADLSQLEAAMRANVEGLGLLLQHTRKAKAALVMSGMGIYTGHDDPWHAYTEADPIGRGATAYAPTSPASKLGVEAVARYCARAFDLPVVITRLNTFDGARGSFPAMHINAVLEGRRMVAPSDPNPHSPIHVEDMKEQLEALLDAAAVPALITNWCGDDVVTAQQWVEWASAWAGKPGGIDVVAVPGAPAGALADPTRRRSITGPCRMTTAASFRRLYDEIAEQGQDA